MSHVKPNQYVKLQQLYFANEYYRWMNINSCCGSDVGEQLLKFHSLESEIKGKSSRLRSIGIAFDRNVVRLFSVTTALTTMYIGGKCSTQPSIPNTTTCEVYDIEEVVNWMSALKPKYGGWFENLMELQVVACWTAFETLASDLWVAAINENPSLATLRGTPSRIAKGKRKKPESNESQLLNDLEKSISLADISRLTRGSFDIQKQMGSILKSRFKFSSLDGIRRAYSSAFSEKEKCARSDDIDISLSDQALDALSAVRNLIVHKAGIVDAVYLDDIKSAPNAPHLAEGSRLGINGDMVCNLIQPVMTCCVNLIRSVDTWLSLIRSADDDKNPAS